ncbi:release factor glutamine methyltransferase [Lipingzhangella halophila]|uniref:Release factor glutamine methyltransferase n=1 Tax=Lipingzhangella halophila TaxID=1783352 RepID=A0A7W7RLL8_9ACTN|nr:methyltransferase [Lipingzhangella halophila]MBB4934224.1 release factor glutamine methyltransferase [Lipingzhangella halophila]
MHDPTARASASRESWELWRELPDPLPAEAIIAANQPREDVGTHRSYTYRDWEFTVPPGVFSPGLTSELVFDRLLDGTIVLAGRSYAVMGCGLGVEAVIAASRGARDIYALDVHPESTRTTADNFTRLAGAASRTTLAPITSDLFAAFPQAARADVITFNPPAVKEAVSHHPDIVRNTCVGGDVVTRFLDQVAERDLLTPGGEVYVVLSNTAELHRITGHAIESGYSVEIAHSQGWPGSDVRTFLFRLRRP